MLCTEVAAGASLTFKNLVYGDIGDHGRSDFQCSIDANRDMTRSRYQRRLLKVDTHRAVPKNRRQLSQYARFVLAAGRLIGDSDALQAPLGKSWISLSCIHADLACHCVAA